MPNSFRSYAPAWEGDLLLACRKCQKKIKDHHGLRALSTLKKSMKRRNMGTAGAPLHILNVSCMNICPKRAVAICSPGGKTPRLAILRTETDIDRLCLDGFPGASEDDAKI